MRVADRDHELPDAEVLGVAELGRGHVAVEPEDGEIGKWVGTDELERELAPRR